MQTLKYKLLQIYGDPIATNSTAVGVGIQNDGKIVIVGTADMSRQALGGRDLEFAVARFNRLAPSTVAWVTQPPGATVLMTLPRPSWNESVTSLPLPTVAEVIVPSIA